MNSADPSGRPVCVHRRRATNSDAVSPACKNFRQFAADHCWLQRSMSRQASGSPVPQCAAALDHGQAIASPAIPARTRFSSA